MNAEELCYLPATEALQLFRQRELSPVELLKAQIARADRLEPQLNAFCSRRLDEAQAAARAAEQTWLHRPDAARALEACPRC